MPLLNWDLSSVWDHPFCLLSCCLEELWPVPSSVVQAMPSQGWMQCPGQTFCLIGLRDEVDLVLEGKELPTAEANHAVLLVFSAH